MRWFCCVFRKVVLCAFLLSVISCGKGGGVAGKLGALGGTGGILGDVGKLVNAHALNSEEMMMVRRDITVLQGKLSILASKRMHDFSVQSGQTGRDLLRRMDQWIGRVMSVVLQVSARNIEQIESEFRQDLAGHSVFQSYLHYLIGLGALPTYTIQNGYTLIYNKCLQGAILVEILNIRAHCAHAMLSVLMNTVEGFAVPMDKIKALRSRLSEVVGSAPV